MNLPDKIMETLRGNAPICWRVDQNLTVPVPQDNWCRIQIEIRGYPDSWVRVEGIGKITGTDGEVCHVDLLQANTLKVNHMYIES